MKSSVSRLAWMLCLGYLAVTVALPGCQRKGNDVQQGQSTQASDTNFALRQAKMKEISAICSGIHKMLKRGTVDHAASDVKKLQNLMAEAAKIPPPVDAQKYAFYAAEFQKRTDVLAIAAATGSVEQTRPKFTELADTCGACHYTCKYPTD